MTGSVIAFVIGLITGFMAGTVVMCAMVAASEDDRRREYEEHLEQVEEYYKARYTKWEEVEKQRDKEREEEDDGEKIHET